MTSSLAYESALARAILADVQDTVRDDEEAIEAVVEGETGLMEAIDQALKRIEEIEALSEALRTQATTVKARIARFEAQRDRLREALSCALAETGLKRLERPLATLSLAKGRPGLVVSDLDAIPDELVVTTIERRPQRALIVEALASGRDVPGVAVSNAKPILQIRRG